jgi:hypothetical protein
MSFVFDEATHTYLLDGVRLPSVTQIMKPLYDFSSVPAEVLKRAGEFGTAVHKSVELHLWNDLDMETLDDNLKGPLTAFISFQAGNHDLSIPDRIETPFYHSKLNYAGTPDMEYITAIIDLKSRPVNLLTDSIQLAAYDHMTGDGKRKRYVLELKQDGTYILTLVNPTVKQSNEAWSRFRALLDYHNAGNLIKSWRTK